MKLRRIAAALVIVSLGAAGFTFAAVRGQMADCRITEKTIVGDAAAAAGLTASFGMGLQNQLYWKNVYTYGGADDGAGLHLGDLGIGDRETATAVAQHRVELVQGVDGGFQVVKGQAHIVGESTDFLVLMWQELVQGRIQVADGHRVALHRLENALKVAALHGQQFCERALALFYRLGDDHLADGGDPVGLKEHMLGAAQADALRAESVPSGCRHWCGLSGCGSHPPSP